MFGAIFELWYGLPPYVRAAPAVILILISTLLWFSNGVIWPYGWIVGGVLLLLSGPSDSEKKGYHF